MLFRKYRTARPNTPVFIWWSKSKPSIKRRIKRRGVWGIVVEPEQTFASCVWGWLLVIHLAVAAGICAVPPSGGKCAALLWRRWYWKQYVLWSRSETDQQIYLKVITQPQNTTAYVKSGPWERVIRVGWYLRRNADTSAKCPEGRSMPL